MEQSRLYYDDVLGVDNKFQRGNVGLAGPGASHVSVDLFVRSANSTVGTNTAVHAGE